MAHLVSGIEARRTIERGTVPEPNAIATGRSTDSRRCARDTVPIMTIEQALWAHPSVRSCAVVGWRRGGRPRATAFVELDDGAELSEDDLLSFCRDRVGRVGAPGQIVYVSGVRRHG